MCRPTETLVEAGEGGHCSGRIGSSCNSEVRDAAFVVTLLSRNHVVRSSDSHCDPSASPSCCRHWVPLFRLLNSILDLSRSNLRSIIQSICPSPRPATPRVSTLVSFGQFIHSSSFTTTSPSPSSLPSHHHTERGEEMTLGINQVDMGRRRNGVLE